ncbi:MAG: SRPBCC domain-containing protein [Steroidobacteraceae bacterium]
MKRFLVMLAAFAATASAQETITTEGVIEAPVAQVWNAWATSRGLRAWLSPHADIDLRVGGLMRSNYNEKGTLGDAGTIENKVLSFEPQRMLSIQVARAPADFPFRARVGEMWTVLYFTPAPGNKTLLRIVALGFKPDADAQVMRDFFNRGNAATLTQLQEYFSRCRRANTCG